jgi:hypothetical protein
MCMIASGTPGGIIKVRDYRSVVLSQTGSEWRRNADRTNIERKGGQTINNLSLAESLAQ